MKPVARFLSGLLFITTFLGCAILRVTSDPPGAPIYYSKTGIAPWRPWPPGSEKPRKTPSWKLTRPEPYVFVRVEKEGYYPVRPVFLDVGMFRHQRVHFVLDETFERRQREKGLVRYEGEWMSPEEKFRREQNKKGLFFYKPTGQWVSLEKLEELKAEAKRAEGFVQYNGAWVKPAEEGLVEYKNRWMKPAEAETRRSIDSRVRGIVASGKTFRFEIRRNRPSVKPGAQLWIADLTGQALEVLLSGPASQQASVLPYHSVTIHSEPGTYTIVVREILRPSVPAAITTIALEQNRSYSWTYRGPNAPAEEPGPEIPQPKTQSPLLPKEGMKSLNRPS